MPPTRVLIADDEPGVLELLSTVGVYPQPRRLGLRNAVAAHGVSNVVPLGRAERAFAGTPHDGMRVLAELLEWTKG